LKIEMGNKRQHNRLDIIGLAHIIGGASDLPLEAQILDINYHGMRVCMKEPTIGQVVAHISHFADGIDKRIDEMVRGQIIWTKKKGMWYQLGIKLAGLNPKDHSGIIAFLDKYLKLK